MNSVLRREAQDYPIALRAVTAMFQIMCKSDDGHVVGSTASDGRNKEGLQSVVTSHRMSAWLNLFRWMAALAVVITHVNNRLLVPFAAVPHDDRSLLLYGWTFLAGFAHQAVMIFFVLSGFLVGGTLLLEVQATGNADLKGYFIKRLSRLYVVVLPALILGYALDHAGITLTSGRTDFYPTQVIAALAPSVFACNVFFLQTIECVQFGSNGALWSLANEFWYYVLWPLLLAPFMTQRILLHRIIMVVTGLGIGAWLSTAKYATFPIVPYMLPWIIGVIPIFRRTPIIGRTPRRAILLFFGILLTIRLGVRGVTWEAYPVVGYILDIIVSLSFSNMLSSLRSEQLARPLPWNAFHRWAADFSYSLYTVHTPVITALGAMLLSCFGVGWKMQPSTHLAWALTISYLMCAIACAYGFSLLTEVHTG